MDWIDSIYWPSPSFTTSNYRRKSTTLQHLFFNSIQRNCKNWFYHCCRQSSSSWVANLISFYNHPTFLNLHSCLSNSVGGSDSTIVLIYNLLASPPNNTIFLYPYWSQLIWQIRDKDSIETDLHITAVEANQEIVIFCTDWQIDHKRHQRIIIISFFLPRSLIGQTVLPTC